MKTPILLSKIFLRKKANALIIFSTIVFCVLAYAVSQDAQEAPLRKREFDVNGVVFSMVKIDVPDNCVRVEIKPSYHERIRKNVCEDYWIGETEVTQQLYEAVMGNNPSSAQHKGPNNPVNKVNLWDAKVFLERISERTTNAFRLPTQAEWVHTCRAAALAEPHIRLGWVVGNSGRKSHPVATSDRNAIGIYDMLGNVAEWAKPDKPLRPGDDYYWVLGHHYNSGNGAGCSEATQRYSFNRTPIIGLRLATDD